MNEVETERSGFIYIMTTPSVSRLIKVGMTVRNPFLRIRDEDLNPAGIRGRFTVTYASWFQDVKLAAERTHTALKKFHAFREYFRTDVVTGINLIENLGLWYSRITTVDPCKPEQAAPCGNTPEQLVSFDQFEPRRALPALDRMNCHAAGIGPVITEPGIPTRSCTRRYGYTLNILTSLSRCSARSERSLELMFT